MPQHNNATELTDKIINNLYEAIELLAEMPCKETISKLGILEYCQKELNDLVTRLQLMR